jgi:hypothetical protein
MSLMDRRKVTEVNLWLFGKPAWEMEIEGWKIDEWTPEELEEKGKELQRRMQRKADITRNLLLNGWKGEGGLYTISFYKKAPIEKAKNELAALWIKPDEVSLEEHEDDGEAFLEAESMSRKGGAAGP